MYDIYFYHFIMTVIILIVVLFRVQYVYWNARDNITCNYAIAIYRSHSTRKH